MAAATGLKIIMKASLKITEGISVYRQNVEDVRRQLRL